MDCLDFRRALTANPGDLEAAAAAHVLRCSACREFHARAVQFERRLGKALRVPVPARLTDRLLAGASPRRAARWHGAAAAVLLAAGVAAVIGLRDDPLARAGIDFVVHEEAQAIAEAKPVDAAVLVRAAAEMGVSLPPQLGSVRYICFYPFSGGAHHLLVTTALGKATLLLIPGRPLAARAAASAHGLEAALVPVRGGTLAIVTASARSLTRIEGLLN